MPQFILKNNVFNLFTYGFYDKLNTQLKNHTPMNPAFLAQGTKFDKKIKNEKKRRKVFNTARNQMYPKVVEQHNIHSLEQGTFLILDPFTHVSHREQALKGEKVPRYMLLAQLFDDDQQPLFVKASKQKTLQHLPSIHPENKRLALAFMETVPDKETTSVSNTLQVIQGPSHWTDQLQGDWEYLDNDE